MEPRHHTDHIEWDNDPLDPAPLMPAFGVALAIVAVLAMLGGIVTLVLRFLEAIGRAVGWE